MRKGYDLPGMNKQIIFIPSREEYHKTKDPVEKQSKGDTCVTSLKNSNKQELQIPENDELDSICKNLKNVFLSGDILRKGMIKEASATVKLDPEDMRKQEIQLPIRKEFKMKDRRNKFQLREEFRTYSSNFDLQKQEPFITKK